MAIYSKNFLEYELMAVIYTIWINTREDFGGRIFILEFSNQTSVAAGTGMNFFWLPVK